jgi:hypothetical protein
VEEEDKKLRAARLSPGRSNVRGFIPTGQYPSAVAFAGGRLFVGNGKGTGFVNSSLVVDNSGRAPNTPNESFPAGRGRGGRQGGQYSVSLVAGNLSAIPEPGERELARYTQAVMRNNGLVGPQRAQLFDGRAPIKHVIYVIKENRTYDQVFGDVAASGDGTRADGDPSLAIFGASDGASSNMPASARLPAFDAMRLGLRAEVEGEEMEASARKGDDARRVARMKHRRATD